MCHSFYWDGSQIAGTLTANNAGGSQRMPDKENFNCVIVLEGNGARPSHHGDGYLESDKMYTLNTIERHAVCYSPNEIGVDLYNQCTTGDKAMAIRAAKADSEHIPCVLAIDRAAFNQGENAQYDFQISGGGTAQTIIAKGPGAVCYKKPSEAYKQETSKESETNM